MTELEQTIEDIKQTLLVTGANSAFETSAFPRCVPYNLTPAARLTKPILSPLLNITPRVFMPGGVCSRHPDTGKDMARMALLREPGGEVEEVETPIGRQVLQTKIIFETQYAGVGQIDAKALAMANLLRAFKIQEEDNLLRGAYSSSEADTGVLNYNPQAFQGLFAQMAELMDHINFLYMPDRLVDAIRQMATEMGERNGAPPDLCYLNTEQAQRVTVETIGNSTPYVLQTQQPRPIMGAPAPPPPSPFAGMRVSRIALLEGPFAGHEVHIQAHPYMPAGEAVLLTTTLPEELREKVDPDRIPAPWSVGCAYDYLYLDYEPVSPLMIGEIRNMVAFRLHCPFLVGWIRGCPK